MLLSQPSRFFSFFINLVNVERDLLQQPHVMTDAQQGFLTNAALVPNYFL